MHDHDRKRVPNTCPAHVARHHAAQERNSRGFARSVKDEAQLLKSEGLQGNVWNMIHGGLDEMELAAFVGITADKGLNGLKQALMVVTNDEANAVQAAPLDGF